MADVNEVHCPRLYLCAHPPHECLARRPHTILTKTKLTPRAVSLIFCRLHYARDLFIWASLGFLDLFGRACGSLLSTPSTFTEPKARSHSAERSKATEIKLIVLALYVTSWNVWGLLGRELLPMTGWSPNSFCGICLCSNSYNKASTCEYQHLFLGSLLGSFSPWSGRPLFAIVSWYFDFSLPFLKIKSKTRCGS